MAAPKARRTYSRKPAPKRPQTSGGPSRKLFNPKAKLNPSQVIDVRGRTTRLTGHPTRPVRSYKKVAR